MLIVKGMLTTYERRESIKAFLLKARTTTASELAMMFKVTRQTISNDIVFLSNRLPIITKPGCGGGIFLNKEFESPREYLSKEEENLLIYISKFLNKKEQIMINNIINKFSIKRGE